MSNFSSYIHSESESYLDSALFSETPQSSQSLPFSESVEEFVPKSFFEPPSSESLPFFESAEEVVPDSSLAPPSSQSLPHSKSPPPSQSLSTAVESLLQPVGSEAIHLDDQPMEKDMDARLR